MKRLAAALLAAWAPAAQAQQPAPPRPGCDSPESKQFDFWLGDWEAAFKRPDGTTAASRNRVTKILDGCAVLEEFTGPPGTPLVGRSHSTYDRGAQRWKQTWVDNMGSYLDFAGEWKDGRMVLSREAQAQGKKFLQRMVWQDIRPEAFKWLWQRSDDGGATWATSWEIDYRRVK